MRRENTDMTITPSLDRAKELAATGRYDILPVSCELLSDFITPIEALRVLKNVSTHCYLLESAWANDRWGRYTFLGFDPKLEITCKDGSCGRGASHPHRRPIRVSAAGPGRTQEPQI